MREQRQKYWFRISFSTARYFQMIVPNKIISIDESVVFKAAKLLSKLDKTNDVLDLYSKNKQLFMGIPDYIEALDILFILKKIDLDLNNGVIKIA